MSNAYKTENIMYKPSGFEDIVSEPLDPMISATLTVPCRRFEIASIQPSTN